MADLVVTAPEGVDPTGHGNPDPRTGHGLDDPHAVHVTSTGLSNNKLAMWLFLGSECLLFGGLISTYMLYRGRHVGTPGPAQVYDIQIEPVAYPSNPKTIPTTAYSRERRSFLKSLLRKNLTACTIDIVNNIIIANHMHTWK